jgi:hypothetical protein
MHPSQPPPPLPSSNAISTPPGDPQDQRPGARLVKREAVTGASGGSVRETRTISHAEPATGHLTRWWRGGVRTARVPGWSLASERSGRRGCQAGAWGRADGANRESRQRPYGASHGEVGRRRCRVGASLRSGAVGAGARRGPGVEQTVQIANPDKDPMERRTVRPAGADARWEPRFGAERSARVPGGGLGSSKRRKSRIPTKTLWSVARWGRPARMPGGSLASGRSGRRVPGGGLGSSRRCKS